MAQVGTFARSRVREILAALVAAFLLASTMTVQGASPSSAASPERVFSVIVQSTAGTAEAAADAVKAVGGSVTHNLEIVGGVAADVTDSMMDRLGRLSGVFNVTENAKVGFNGQPGSDKDKPKRIQQVVRADKLWNEGITGDGVTVALLDTGVYAQHPDLQGPNGSRVIACEDLTSEAGTEAECADTFGHGTFMAGLIAGNGASSNGKYSGAAPKANIASIKVAGFDGSTDIAKILAGVQWAVAHRSTYNIKVLNLSLGSDSAQDYRLSPLNYAVERAWKAGIAVVVSAGNSGPDGLTVMKPGDDPYVITVGASNDEGTMSIGDDRVPVFSSRGPTRSNGLAKPDVVSPGVHTTSLRSPGSAIDQQYGSTAAVDGNYFKGTGTSMSTATVSGVVAQILEANPSLNPNQVKHRVMSTARSIADSDKYAVGKGLIDAYGAARSSSILEANLGVTRSTGLGLLELDRGSIGFELEVVTPIGALEMHGEFSPQTDPENIDASNPAGLVPYSSLDYTTTGWDPESWNGTQWKDEDWAGTQWKGTQWKATVWDGTQWKGTQWKNDDWNGTQWKDVDWDGTQWKGTQWKSAWYAAAWD